MFYILAQLHDKATKLRIAREENSKLLANLQNLSAERDDLKTAVVIAETSSNDKIAAIDIKYQEEIASLKAIMHGMCIFGRDDERFIVIFCILYFVKFY